MSKPEQKLLFKFSLKNALFPAIYDDSYINYRDRLSVNSIMVF